MFQSDFLVNTTAAETSTINTLVLNILSYVSHSKGDINVMFLGRLVKAISLIKSIKSVF